MSMQVYLFHHLVGYGRYVDKYLCPIKAWSEEENIIIMKWIDENGGLESLNVTEFKMVINVAITHNRLTS